MELVKLYEKDFVVRGAHDDLISYWYEMTIGYNFLVGHGIKVLLSRTDIDVDILKNDDPFTCLYDRSCVLALMSNKNELKLDLILTSGQYRLTFFEQQSVEMRKFFTDDAGLQNVPITFKLSSYPVI